MPQNIERIHNAFAVLNDIKIMRNDLSNLFITAENANDKFHTETMSKILN